MGVRRRGSVHAVSWVPWAWVLQATLVLGVVGALVPSSRHRFRVWSEDLCPDGHIACNSDRSQRQCIGTGDICDAVGDCDNESDERHCTACHNGAVHCESEAKCVRAEWRCDGTRDCADGEDEEGCPADGSTTYLGVHYDADMKYACKSTKRWAFTLCDGVNDCPDGSDEAFEFEHCVSRTSKKIRYHERTASAECALGSVLCHEDSQGNHIGTCLIRKKVCDGWSDCRGGEDESQCGTNATTTTTTTGTTRAATPQAASTRSRSTTSTSTTTSSTSTSLRPTARETVATASSGGGVAWASARHPLPLDGDDDAEDVAASLRAIKVALVLLCVIAAGVLAALVAALLLAAPGLRERRWWRLTRLAAEGGVDGYGGSSEHQL